MPKIRVAAIQALSLADSFNDKWSGVDVPRALALLDDAVAQGAELICFPEMYPLVGKEELVQRAKHHGIYIVAGLAEGEKDSWYNASLLIGPAGDVLGMQTKNIVTEIESSQGVQTGSGYRVIETEVGRIGIVICADLAFSHEAFDTFASEKVDIIVNPVMWFALAQGYPHVVVGRHMEYSAPIIGVNVARPKRPNDAGLPAAGGYSTICVPPSVQDMDQLWDWFRDKPGGIDGISDFIHTLGTEEEIFVIDIDIDIDAVRKFPGYVSTRSTARTA